MKCDFMMIMDKFWDIFVFVSKIENFLMKKKIVCKKKMKSSLFLISVFVLLSLSFGQLANLLALKDYKEDYVVEGRNLTVVVSFHNLGEG